MKCIWCLSIIILSVSAQQISPEEQDIAYREYLATVYAHSQEWYAFANMYEYISEVDPARANEILKLIPKKEVVDIVKEKKIKAYQENKRLPSFGKREWPNAKSDTANNYELIRALLESKQWIPLANKLLEITKTPDYKTCAILKKIVVAGALATIDHSSIFPSCLAPWAPSAKPTIEQQAFYLKTILELRLGKLVISQPKDACQKIDVNNLAQCLRILTVGGYKRVDELYGNLNDGDEKTAINFCFNLERKGPKNALKVYYQARAPQDEHLVQFINTIRPSLQLLSPWHLASKTLSMACPCADTELPINRRIAHTKKTNLTDEPAKLQIKNMEKLFWVLLAAQNKELAKEYLTRLEEKLKPILEILELKPRKKERIKETLKFMGEKLYAAETIDLKHVSAYQSHMDSAIQELLKGDIVEAERLRSDVLVAVRKNLTSDSSRPEENPSVKYLTLLIAAFQNPQVLNPESIEILNFSDWDLNWYIVQAVNGYRKGNFVELLGPNVPENIRETVNAHVLFFAGRFRDVLKAPGAPDKLRRFASLCSIKKKEVCSFQISGSDWIGEIAKTVIPSLCEAAENSKKVRFVRDSIIKPSAKAQAALKNVGADWYLQPPLPGDIPQVPLASITVAPLIAAPISLDPLRKVKLRREEQRQLREKYGEPLIKSEKQEQPKNVKNNTTDRANRLVQSLANVYHIIRHTLEDPAERPILNLDANTRGSFTTVLRASPVLRDRYGSRIQKGDWDFIVNALETINAVEGPVNADRTTLEYILDIVDNLFGPSAKNDDQAALDKLLENILE